MPRTRRISLIGHPHVITARGNAGSPLFFEDADYESYLRLLRDYGREDLFRLYAYCLMRNEVRLVIEPKRLRLAQMVQRLHGSHSRRVNHRLSRRGHLFEGRFQSVIIPRDQIPEAVRALHLWPVRVDRVRRAETYPWSSHRAYVGQGDEWGDLVDAWSVLERFGETLPMAQHSFSSFVESVVFERDGMGVNETIPGIAGDRSFAEAVLAEAGVVWRGRRRPAMKTLAGRVSLLMNIHQEDLISNSRKQDLVVARRLLATTAVRRAGRSVTEVARYLNRDKSQISRLVAQGMDLLRMDEAFHALVDQVYIRSGRETPAAD